jgi:hypothetical protein
MENSAAAMCIEAMRRQIPPMNVHPSYEVVDPSCYIGTFAVDGVHQTQTTVWVRHILEPHYEKLDKSPLFRDVLIGWMIVLGLKLCELPS